MITINTVDGQKFSINGVNYFKNFMPYAVGADKINIVNAYNDFVLIPSPAIYSDFIVDGIIYGSQVLLQDALLPVLFSRDTLGGGDAPDKLDKDILDYDAVSLPLVDSDKLLVNRVGTWYKVDKSEIGGDATSKLNKDFSTLPTATTPLLGTETIAINQGGEPKELLLSEVGGGGGGVPEEDIWTYFKGDLYMCQATGTGTSNIGYPAQPTIVGTPANLPANLSGDYTTLPNHSWNSRRAISASTAGSNASVTWGWKNVSCGLGFYASAKANIIMTTNGRFFLGFTDSTSDIGNVNPSSLTNILGFGIDSLDSNLQIIHNDSTGTATKVDLGSDFSINATSNNTYLLEIWNFKGSSNVYFRIKNLLTDITSAIIGVTTDVPTVTDGLAFHLWANNGTDASVVHLYFSNHTLKRQS